MIGPAANMIATLRPDGGWVGSAHDGAESQPRENKGSIYPENPPGGRSSEHSTNRQLYRRQSGRPLAERTPVWAQAGVQPQQQSRAHARSTGNHMAPPPRYEGATRATSDRDYDPPGEDSFDEGLWPGDDEA